MNFIPTKFIGLILFVFFLIFNLSCTKDSDLFKEAVSEDIEKNIGDSSSSEGNDGLTLLTKTFVPVQDAYVQDGQGYDVDIIRIENGRRKSYLTFDLSEVNGPIEDAKLVLTVSQDAGYGTFEAYEGSDTDWTEETLNQSNAPQENLLLGSTIVYDGESYFQIDLNANDLIGDLTNIVLIQRDGNDIAVASRENVADVVPKLTLTYLGTPENGDQNAEENTDNNDNSGSDDSNNNDGGSSGDDSNNNDGGSGDDSNTGGNSDRTGDTNYFVRVDGDNSNDGLTEATAFRTIQRAVDHAEPGDIVWVKAGNYGGATVFSRRNGTASKPIRIIGYQNAPNDIVSDVFSTYTREDFNSDGEVLPNNIMPLIQTDRGSDNDPDPGDNAFTINHDYIWIENFMGQYNDMTVRASGTKGLTLINIVSNETGNWDPTNPQWNDPVTYAESTGGNLSGHGLRLSNCDEMLVKNCIVFNAGHVGIDLISSDNNTLENNTVVVTKDGNPTDYHQTLWSSDNNVVRNFVSIRKTGVSHQSRAYAIKCDSNNNLIEGGYAENLRFQCYFNSDDNVFKDITLISTTGQINEGGVQIFGDSNRNAFINFKMYNSGGIMFLGSNYSECESRVSFAPTAGSNNLFINPVIKNIHPWHGGFIEFMFLGPDGDDAGTNYVIGGTFDGAPYLFKQDRPVENIILINTSINNVTDGFKTSRDNNTSYSFNATYDHVNFHNVAFSIPSGTNVTTLNPGFNNPMTDDYTLSSNSQLIGIGVNASSISNLSAIDHNNNPRPSSSGWSIGAFEN
ncbi:DUF7594 domain-containing protein [Flagellimonas lutaonensis]|uniref:Carbohydrate-binding module family 96 domain-containing protein n=1 Tax=Flagellimonas lutaonensis TaxID=516051 RepID=A0A0D5YW57_9FLAO|nr:hypothetical protein [Allomuricauda lutaonensis]AKA36083.1 hypothetical protein VC82_2511 [Allomuricauda lutaonensis]